MCPESADRRKRLHRTADRHEGVPDELIDQQVAKADEALELLGDEEELVETAEDALDRNLDTVERALGDGAETASADDPGPGREPPARA